MTATFIAYLILAIFVVVAVLALIDMFIKRFIPIGCVVLFLLFVLAAFVYTLIQ